MDALCLMKSNIALFYDKVHLWTIDKVLFLEIRMQICVPLTIDLICGFVLIFICGLLSVSVGADYS